MLFFIFALFICTSEATNSSDPLQYSCENSTLYLKCSTDLVLKIQEAFYGKSQENICPTTGNGTSNCTIENVTAGVADRCDKKQNCNIEVTNSLLGNPCPGFSNYLSVNFTCVNATGSIKIADQCGANEHSAADVCMCDDRCSTRGIVCPTLCVSKGCVCNNGYQRDPFTNYCILKEYCPSSANLNASYEVFSDCANCQLTCGHIFRNDTRCEADTKCEPGYACHDGYAREMIIGQCVRKGECFRGFPRGNGK
ncbi:Calcium-independent receptor for alpha-latrotoxin [Carabus blaptoides fortunei]